MVTDEGDAMAFFFNIYIYFRNAPVIKIGGGGSFKMQLEMERRAFQFNWSGICRVSVNSAAGEIKQTGEE